MKDWVYNSVVVRGGTEAVKRQGGGKGGKGHRVGVVVSLAVCGKFLSWSRI